MRGNSGRGALTFLIAALLGLLPATRGITQDRVHQDRSAQGMVVSASAASSRIGRDVLARGGNAVDAAVATAFALAVTWPEAGNIGGGGFMMIFPGESREPVCIDYREIAPAASTITMFAREEDGRFTHKIVGVPGTVRGLSLAHQQYGKLLWKDLVLPAVQLAANGFEVDRHLAKSINDVMAEIGENSDPRYAELRRVYGNPAGRTWQTGDRLVLKDLAETLRQIAEQGADSFYRGAIADRIAAEMRASRDGLITRADLAAYQAKIRRPIRGTYRGYEILGPPPPSSGGTCLVQALNILERFELRDQDRYSARTMHLLAEAMRRVFIDRARHLGDPDFVAIPSSLTDKTYADALAETISLVRATPSESIAPEILLEGESTETTHFSIVDASGMAVSNTYTLEGSWGARIVVRGAGFLLNNEMGDFNWLPGVTDRTGRVGTVPNQIAPHKRMLSSQTPTIVAREGRIVLVTGTPGGRTIINTVLQIVLNVLEFDMELAEAVQVPRQHHQWLPDQLAVEEISGEAFGQSLGALRAMGHHVIEKSSPQGSAHSIWVDPQTGEYVGVADWRRGGLAAGVKIEAP